MWTHKIQILYNLINNCSLQVNQFSMKTLFSSKWAYIYWRAFLKSQRIKVLQRKLLTLVQSGIWPLQTTKLLKPLVIITSTISTWYDTIKFFTYYSKLQRSLLLNHAVCLNEMKFNQFHHSYLYYCYMILTYNAFSIHTSIFLNSSLLLVKFLSMCKKIFIRVMLWLYINCCVTIHKCIFIYSELCFDGRLEVNMDLILALWRKKLQTYSLLP